MMRPLSLRNFLLGLAGLGLAACDQATPRVVEMFISENGTHRYLAEASQNGPIHLQVLPNAIASASGYADIALRLFNDTAAQRSKRIFTTEPAEARSAVRVILFVGAEDGAGGTALCRGQPARRRSGRKGDQDRRRSVRAAGPPCRGAWLGPQGHRRAGRGISADHGRSGESAVPAPSAGQIDRPCARAVTRRCAVPQSPAPSRGTHPEAAQSPPPGWFPPAS